MPKLSTLEDANVRYLTPKECAAYLRISPWTFYDWLKKPNGPPHKKVGGTAKSGGCIRIPKASFFKWLDNNWSEKRA